MRLIFLKTSIIIFLWLLSSSTFSQNGSIRGNIIDKLSGKPVEYSTIALINIEDSTIITGTLSDNTGYFILSDLAYSSYLIKIQFMGYQSKIMDISLSDNNRHINIGEIILKPSTIGLEEVKIVADKPYVQYKIDKKIVNVSQHLNASGGTAADVLENIPSIEANIEGDIKLRGSSDFTVLIDGKPTVIDGSDLLNQVPSSTIEKIEIITNPSAKYDPDGTAGIINVILKKGFLEGLSGIVNISGGTGYQYGADASVNYRTKKFVLSGGIEYSNNNQNTTESSNRETYLNDTTIYLTTRDEGIRFNGRTIFKGGFEYYLSARNILSLSGKYNMLSIGHETDIQNHQWNNLNGEDLYYLSEDKFKIEPDVLEFNFGDEHFFDSLGMHKLSLNSHIVFADVNTNENLIKYLTNADWQERLSIYEKLKRNTLENTKVFDLDLDYTRPIGETGTFEAGYQLSLLNSDNDYQVQNYDDTTGQWVTDNNQSNSVSFKRNIHALYGTFSNNFGLWEAKVGLRIEYTDRLLSQETLNEDYTYKKLDFYPSAYLTRKLPYDQQVQVSYSRRINRPRIQFLNPYTFFSDGFTAVKGNPELEPDYANSFELNYQKKIGASFVSVETYFRQTNNKITRTQEVDEDGILVRSMKNLDSDYSLGLEAMASLKPLNWLELIPKATWYKYHLEGEYNAADIVKNSQNWRASLSSSIRLKSNTRIQLNSNYESPSVTLDGEREGFFFMGMAVKQDLFKGNASLTFRVEDIFDSRRMKITSTSDDFFQHSEFWAAAPQFIISFKYSFSNFQNGGDRDKDFSNQYDIY